MPRSYRRYLWLACVLVLTMIASVSAHVRTSIPLVRDGQSVTRIEPSSRGAESVLADTSQRSNVALATNLGNYHHPITTRSPLAQQYFDQGLILAYGFNHPGAARSFREAARLDPTCAMCYWGVGLVLGPNINAGMAKADAHEAWQAVQTAIAHSQHATPKEQAYIQALAKRYAAKPPADRRPLDLAYANAMRQVARQFPDDPDAGTLFAEALMDTMPWNYWDNGKPKPATVEILNHLEAALQRDPNHPGANHFYIHAVEASPNPAQGIASADRLNHLVPGSGHLLHMPSHLYIQLGRYHDAVMANQRAIAADQAYLAQSSAKKQTVPLYMLHNHHFLWTAAMMGGESQVALKTARDIAAVAEAQPQQTREQGRLQHFEALPLYTLNRFGLWEQILAQTAPAADLKYPLGVWHFARSTAFRAQGQLPAAQRELQQLQAIAHDPALQSVTIDGNAAATLLKLATHVVAGELAAEQGKPEAAIRELKSAIALEDSLSSGELQAWHAPVRQTLGMVLLAANRPAEAAAVYREDLKNHADNGWSLFGLAESLRRQGKLAEAQTVQAQFERAWKEADVKLAASTF